MMTRRLRPLASESAENRARTLKSRSRDLLFMPTFLVSSMRLGQAKVVSCDEARFVHALMNTASEVPLSKHSTNTFCRPITYMYPPIQL